MENRNFRDTLSLRDFEYEDPYESTFKTMQRAYESLRRPTWSYPDIICPVDYQQLFNVPDSEISQFEEKYLGKETDPENVTFNFTPIQPSQPPVRDQPSTSTVAHNWVFVPEVIQTKDLQIVKQEPWGYPRCEENLPVHFSYEEAQKIMIEPLQFDDPLKEGPLFLAPGISHEHGAPQTYCLAPANLKMSPKHLSYPPTPPYDYITEHLVPQLGNVTFDQESNESEKLVAYSSVFEVEKNKNTEGGVTANEPSSHSPNHSQVERAITGDPSVPDATITDTESIVVELPSFAFAIVRVMEEYMFNCWRKLKNSNLPIFTELFGNVSFPDLQPSFTRSCLIKMKDTIFSQPNRNREEEVKYLPILLSLHGVSKALDILMNIDYDFAFESLADFQKIHEAVLHSDYKLLLFQLLRLRKSDEIHPKLNELKTVVLKHLNEDHTKIWIHLHRFAVELAPRIQQFLSLHNIPCVVDTSSDESQKVFDDFTVLISEQLPPQFSVDMLSLVIYYERSSISAITDQQLKNITQKTIEVLKPVNFQEPTALVVSDKNTSETDIPNSSKRSSPDCLSVNPSSLTVTAHSEDVVSKQPRTEFTVNSDLRQSEQTLSGSTRKKSCNDQTHVNPTTELSNQPSEACETVNDEEKIDFEETVSEEVIDTEVSSEEITEMEISTGEHLALVVSSQVISNKDLMKAFNDVGNLAIYECNYGFLNKCADYQPDILFNINTALVIVHEEEDFQQIRLKILTTSLKCECCFVVLLAPSITRSHKCPAHWLSLAGLARFYNGKPIRPMESRFRLVSRLALNYHQVAFITKDVAEDLASNDIQSYFRPLCREAKRLMCFPYFNAVSATLIAQHFTAQQVVELPVDSLCRRLPLLRKNIEFFRHNHDIRLEEHVAQEEADVESSFGVLKAVWYVENESLRECVSFQSPSPNKIAKMNEDYLKKSESPLDVNHLDKIWSSPFTSP